MYDFNPYQPPLTISKDLPRLYPRPPQDTLNAVRSLAIVLSCCGILWGLFFALLIAATAWPVLLIGLPGYIVTFGYLVRSLSYPRPWSRRAIWASSLIVQGGWLAFALVCGTSEFLLRPLGIICVVWWSFATLGSAIALYGDR